MGMYSDPQADSNAVLMAFLSQQQAAQAAAQAAALKAQQDAIYNSQVQAANTAGSQGAQQAAQQIGLQNQYQQAQDASALKAYQSAMAGTGANVTGGAFNLGQAQQNKISNLGSASGYMPNTAYNQIANPKIYNPAATTAAQITPTSNTGVTAANIIGNKQEASTLGGR